MSFHHPLFNLFIFFFLKNVMCSGDACNFDVKVTQALLNQGFHRNLTYRIMLGNKDDVWTNQNCMIALDQTLPPGVYANPDELGELRRTNSMNVLPKNRVNVELPTEQSDATTIYVIGLVSQSKTVLWFPVHARYHKPVSGGGSARNEILPPKIYLRCPDRRLETCGKAVSPSVMLLCNGSSREKCSWREIPFTMITNTLMWEIPVGNLDHYYSVAFGTVLAIASGSMYLLKTIHEYKMSSKKA